jgi:hypothetical protein
MAGPWEQFQASIEPTPTDENTGPWSKFSMRGPEQPEPESVPAPEMTWGGALNEARRNFIPSAGNLVKNVVTPILHPIQTGEALYDIGKGLVSKAAGAVGIDQDPEEKAKTEATADAVGQFFKDRYGGVDEFKNTLAHDPVGLIADLSAALTGGSTLAARAPGIVGRAAQVAGKVGNVVDPILAAGKVAGKAGSAGLHLVTGLGDNVMETAAKAGAQGNRAFLDNMRGNVAPTEVIDLAKSALTQMRNERSAAYKAGMAGVKADPTVLDYTPINDALTDAASNVNFNGIAKSKKAAKTLDKINKVVQEWQSQPAGTPFHTAEGFDALKQAIGEIRQSTDPGTLSRNIADSVYNATKGTIVKQAPIYADTMLGYSDASEKLNELMKTFSLGEKASPDTSLRKLQSVTRNNVNTNYGQRTKLMDDLAKYEPDLLPALAGQATSTILPRGLARLGAHGVLGAGAAYMSPATLPLVLASSPRLAGETAYKVGQGLGALKTAGNRVGAQFAPSLRSSLQTARMTGLGQTPLLAAPSLVGGIGPRYDDQANLIEGQ